jgi:quercetin dioxygenase-like cupin family protein
MRKHAIRTLAPIGIIFLLQSGCATVRLGQQAAETRIVAKELVAATRSWDGKPLPAYPQGQPEVTIRRTCIPAGARLDTHSHPVINAGVMISGQLTVVSADGRTLHLKAGDPIVELVDTQHYGTNEGKIPAEIIVFYAGIADTPITVGRPH